MPCIEKDMRLERVEPGLWRGRISGLRWLSAKHLPPNGGALTSIMVIAVLEEANATIQNRETERNRYEILSCNVLFMRAGLVGPFECRVNILKRGRMIMYAQVTFRQDGKERLKMTAILKSPKFSFEKEYERNWVVPPTPPEIGPFDGCVRLDGGDIGENTVRERIHIFVKPQIQKVYGDARRKGVNMTAKGTSAVAPAMSGYMIYSDSDSAKFEDMPIFLDAAMPSVLSEFRAGWVPTLNLNVHFVTKPSPGPLRFRLRTRHVTGMCLEEIAEIWDSKNALVATSTQVAMLKVNSGSARL